jgi:hypothetical protein
MQRPFVVVVRDRAHPTSLGSRMEERSRIARTDTSGC